MFDRVVPDDGWGSTKERVNEGLFKPQTHDKSYDSNC